MAIKKKFGRLSDSEKAQLDTLQELFDKFADHEKNARALAKKLLAQNKDSSATQPSQSSQYSLRAPRTTKVKYQYKDSQQF